MISLIQLVKYISGTRSCDEDFLDNDTLAAC